MIDDKLEKLIINVVRVSSTFVLLIADVWLAYIGKFDMVTSIIIFILGGIIIWFGLYYLLAWFFRKTRNRI
jgi:hypothetical protein